MKIKVEPLLPTGNYLNVRIGIEMDMPDGASPNFAIKQLWDTIIDIHKDKYPNLYTPEGKPKFEFYQGEDGKPAKQVESVKLSDELSTLIDAINKCTQIEVSDGLEDYSLKSYHTLAKKNLQSITAYNDKLKELQNK